MEFKRENLNNIKDIFEDSTGVQLPNRKRHHPVRMVLVLAAIIACLSISALGGGRFSALEGDEVSFNTEYMGGGILHVEVENRSDSKLEFQHELRLQRVYADEDVPATGKPRFENYEYKPHTNGTMVIDLNGAYDVAELEKPLIDEWYLLTLTNDNFLHGQSWMISVEFSERIHIEPTPKPEIPLDDVILGEIPEDFKDYFLSDTVDIPGRVHLTQNYMQAYERVLAGFDGKIVKSVIPEPNLLIRRTDEQMYDSTLNYHTMDAEFKLVATRDEQALVLGAVMPDSRNPDSGSSVPLFYLMTYPTEEVKDDSYAFIRGRILSFAGLEKNKVYSDEKYTCYEVSEYFYSDLINHAVYCVDTTTRLDDETFGQLREFYDYFKENLPELIYYREN